MSKTKLVFTKVYFYILFKRTLCFLNLFILYFGPLHLLKMYEPLKESHVEE